MGALIVLAWVAFVALVAGILAAFALFWDWLWDLARWKRRHGWWT